MTGADAAPGAGPSSAQAAAIEEYGDAGLLVTPEGDDEQRWATAQSLGRSLVEDPPAGFVDVVASFRHAFVSFDPVTTDHAAMAGVLRDRIAHAAPPLPRHSFTIPVVYGGEWGPDLPDVASLLGITPAEVVALHTSSVFVLRFVGSPIGALFVDVRAIPHPIPRMAPPRVSIPPGSVALSGRQSMVYPVPSPGGWRLIGRTPARLFDTRDPDLVAYRPGDLVRFHAIEPREWATYDGRALAPDPSA